VKARQEAGGRRQEENNYSIKTGFRFRGRYNEMDSDRGVKNKVIIGK